MNFRFSGLSTVRYCLRAVLALFVLSFVASNDASADPVRPLVGQKPGTDMVYPLPPLPTKGTGQRHGESQTGSKPYVTILVKFADNPNETHPLSYFQGLMSNDPGALDNYFREVSYGQMNIAGSVVLGWYTLPSPRSAYITNNDETINTELLMKDAVALVDSQIYFPDFYGINIAYNSTSNYGLGGGAVVTADGQTKVYGATWMPTWGQNNGIYAHEMGHSLGLDHTGDTYGDDYGSRWDPMGSGTNRLPGNPYNDTACHYNAFHKDQLGWIPSSRRFVAAANGHYSIPLQQLAVPATSNNYSMAEIYLGGSATHYYTLEARRRTGYDAVLPGEAVIIHDVDLTRPVKSEIVDGDNNGDPTDAGVQWTVGETYTDAANGVSIKVESLTGDVYTVSVDIVNASDPAVVTNTSDIGPGSLRNALTWSNRVPPQTIRFNIPQSDPGYAGGAYTIVPKSPLPDVTGTGITIDGSSQPGFSSSPIVVLNGFSAGDARGLTLRGPNWTVKNLVINGFKWQGVQVFGASANSGKLQGCYIGTDATGSAAVGNGGQGVEIVQGAYNVFIGGATSGNGNIISGNAYNGIYIGDSSTRTITIRGNIIGADKTKTVALPNGQCGVVANTGVTGVTIGGTSATAGNLISGNNQHGILCLGPGSDFLVQGNIIGTNGSGTARLSNGLDGVLMASGIKNGTIGGSVAGAGNLVSGNGSDGIAVVDPGSANFTIQGNIVGLNAAGTAALGNGSNGILLANGVQSVQIGGTSAAARNLVSGNGGRGVIFNGTISNSFVQGNYIGTGANGTAAIPNSHEGILVITGSHDNTIGGSLAGAGNLISGNSGAGIWMSDAGTSNNIIQGNIIGPDITGTLALKNGSDGIVVANGAQNVTIGGSNSNQLNLISANGGRGIVLGGSGTNNNFVLGNRIGTDISGLTAMANTYEGILINGGAQNNRIGGTAQGEGNLISGNTRSAIWMSDTGTTGNLIQGNYLGTDVTGTKALGNGADVVVCLSNSNTIGGTAAGAGNVIAAGASRGIWIGNGATGNFVQGNKIGTNAAGTAGLPNTLDGILINSGAKNNVIGGTVAAARNLISANLGRGVCLADAGTDSNTVQGNYIGTTVAGSAKLGNALGGVLIDYGATNNLIGGTTSPALNLISGNGASGVWIANSACKGNVVQGNYIGTDVTGSTNLGNAAQGVMLANGANSNTIGGTAAGAGNRIAYNGTAGVQVRDGATVGNSIRGNATYNNGIIGIDLMASGDPASGITANDTGDVDSGSVNNLQNYPVLTKVKAVSSTTTITGTFNGAANKDFSLDFFRSAIAGPYGLGEGQAQNYLAGGTTTIHTDATGNASFNLAIPTSGAGPFFTATATDIVTGDTSEMSRPIITSPSSISISDVTVVEGNTGSQNAVFTLTLSEANSNAVSVNWTTADASALAGRDYTAATGTVTFAAGEISKTVSVPVLGDTIHEANEVFLVKLSNVSGAILARSQAVGTITDDDPVPSFSVTDASVTEGNSGSVNLTFTVKLSATSELPASVNFSTGAAGTFPATAGLDYVALPPTGLTFAPGETQKTVTVSVQGDTLDEENETLALNFASPVNATITDAQGVGTITDDDVAPSLSISDVTQLEGNSGTTAANFTVTLSAPSGRPVTVNYFTVDGTARAGSDYTAVPSTPLTFAPGTTTQTITVNVLGDLIHEANETLGVQLTGAVNATVSDGLGLGTISDDDTVGISVDAPVVTEGNSGTTQMLFTVTLSTTSSSAVTVNYATGSVGTFPATSGVDYLAVPPARLTFAPGEVSKTVTVTVNGDLLDEPDETLSLDLNTPVNAVLLTTQAIGTITDDDAAPSLSLLNLAVAEGDTGSKNATVTVNLSTPSGKWVQLNYATADLTAIAGTDYAAASGTLVIAPGSKSATFNVPILGDLLNEPDETLALNLSAVFNATVPVPQAVLTITNDDPFPALSVNDVQVNEATSATVQATFTVTLAAASGRDVTVHFATGDGTALAGADYTAASGTLTFAPGETSKTVSVTVLADTLAEPTETFNLILSAPVNAALANGTGICTIGDAPPALASITGRCLTMRPDTTFAGVLRAPSPGAPVTLKNKAGVTISTTTADANGNYAFSNLPAGQYTLSAVLERPGQPTVAMDPPSRTVSLSGANLTVERFALFSAFGIIRAPDKSGNVIAVPGVTVKLINPNGIVTATRVTDDQGRYEFRNQRRATFTIQAEASNFTFPSKTVVLPSAGSTWSPAGRANLTGTRKAAALSPSASAF